MSKTKLTVTKNGFIKIDGDFEIVDQATELKSPITKVGFFVFLTSFATLSKSPSRSFDVSSSVGLGGGG